MVNEPLIERFRTRENHKDLNLEENNSVGTKGAIFIDGVDINSVGLDFVRGSLSVIPQDSFLFEGSLGYNLDPMNQFTETEIIRFLKRFDVYRYLIPSSNGGDLDQDKGRNDSLNIQMESDSNEVSFYHGFDRILKLEQFFWNDQVIEALEIFLFIFERL